MLSKFGLQQNIRISDIHAEAKYSYYIQTSKAKTLDLQGSCGALGAEVLFRYFFLMTSHETILTLFISK